MTETWNPYASSAADLAEPAPGATELAGRWTRLGATLLDYLPVLVVGIGAALAIPGFLGTKSGARSQAGMVALAVLFAVALIAWVVYNLRLMHDRGQTWGKMRMGIKVVRSDGRRLSLRRWILLRSVPIAVLGAVPWVGKVLNLVDVLLIFGEERRCLHDMIADTIVVQAQ